MYSGFWIVTLETSFYHHKKNIMRIWIGKIVSVIGLVHCLFGLVMLWPIFLEILADGFFNTVNQQPLREAFFWFEFFGVVLIILGALMDWVERKRLGWPGFLSWALLGMTTSMLMIMPVSGAWLMAIPMVGSFFRLKETKTPLDIGSEV